MNIIKREVSESEIQKAMECGWGREEVLKGYIVSSADFMNGAKHIERLDCIDIFDNDEEAARYAEENDGVKIIHDLPDDIGEGDKAAYLDTEENRRVISNHLWKVYNKKWA